MKKTLFLLLTIISATVSVAQSEKYTTAMKKNLALLDSALANKQSTADVANNFQRIASAEQNQWLPYYYAAYATLMEVMAGGDKSKSDEVADKAEQLITKAEQVIGKENSETCVIKSMIATTHMMVDPMNRYMKYGKASADNITRAMELDPNNPRPYFLEGQAKFFTPASFGGGKDVAKPILQQAVSLFEKFKPESELHPTWGLVAAKRTLDMCN
jgi:hypothetical protein